MNKFIGFVRNIISLSIGLRVYDRVAIDFMRGRL